ncbi:MarR family transcriptional regulator [Vibrio agarivorans]|uniref:MarR family transcriptional regulator n=1 Tax=Vibrio agarivorans TaxID=153622 RepID=UPI0022309A5D|nr:helix-turn-helix domain-containing protein [Vibrio agarivorans]MDN3659695.1 helix-turn-helix domain-containing protein [Vibrio agarivorans]
MIFDIWGQLDDLRRSEKAVLGWLASNAVGNTWTVKFSQKEVMYELGFTQPTVSKAVSRLKELGYVNGKPRARSVYVDFDKLDSLRM